MLEVAGGIILALILIPIILLFGAFLPSIIRGMLAVGLIIYLIASCSPG